MPSSHLLQLNEIMQLIFLSKPQSLLDIGVGFGKYGVLAREYLELWDGRGKYGEWTKRIDGIEVFADYLTPLHDYVYDHIYIGNALDIVPTLECRYDLILLIDVIEHFTLDEGRKLLEACLQKGRNILVSTPKDISSQGDAFDNPYEVHKSQWLPHHFEQLGRCFSVPNLKSYIFFVGEDALRFTSTSARHQEMT